MKVLCVIVVIKVARKSSLLISATSEKFSSLNFQCLNGKQEGLLRGVMDLLDLLDQRPRYLSEVNQISYVQIRLVLEHGK